MGYDSRSMKGFTAAVRFALRVRVVSRLTGVDALVGGLKCLCDSLRGVVFGHVVKLDVRFSCKLFLTCSTKMQKGKQREGEGEDAAARCEPTTRGSMIGASGESSCPVSTNCDVGPGQGSAAAQNALFERTRNL